jgi:hypothetical protein
VTGRHHGRAPRAHVADVHMIREMGIDHLLVTR